MPFVEQSRPRDIAHTLPAKEVETPRSAFEAVATSAARESTRPLQRALMANSHERQGVAQSDGTCPAPDRNSVGPRDQLPETDGTCPAPEHFTPERPSMITRLGEAIKHGLAKLGIIRTELPCE